MSEGANPATPVDPAPVAAPATPAPAAPPAPAGGVPDPAPSPAPAAGDPPADPAAGSTWPEDWRQQYSTDPKIVKQLERYATPKAALDALFAARAKISSGELKTALKPDATAEEQAAWRADNGIPESPDKYELSLPDGLVIGDADKPMVDEFLATAHESNMHPSQVNKALGWYFAKQEEAREAQEARDADKRIACVDALREDFGPEYKKDVKIAMAVLDSAPPGIKDSFLAGRLADGTRLGDSPEVIRWLNTVSRELNPIGTVVPGSGTNAAQAVESEINGLKKMMGDYESEYYKGPNAAKHQARYRELVAARDATPRGR